ncbi:MAG: hypothetical protein KGM18_10855 [Sphingomonadales bacterium]|nr:hypothetical protein [Sphingomonadales bacterium]
MNRTLLAALAVAALALPGVASAHTTRAELRHDHQVVQQERHELARAKHHHNYQRAKAERRELKSAKRELREDRRDYNRTHWH